MQVELTPQPLWDVLHWFLARKQGVYLNIEDGNLVLWNAQARFDFPARVREAGSAFLPSVEGLSPSTWTPERVHLVKKDGEVRIHSARFPAEEGTDFLPLPPPEGVRVASGVLLSMMTGALRFLGRGGKVVFFSQAGNPSLLGVGALARYRAPLREGRYLSIISTADGLPFSVALSKRHARTLQQFLRLIKEEVCTIGVAPSATLAVCSPHAWLALPAVPVPVPSFSPSWAGSARVLVRSQLRALVKSGFCWGDLSWGVRHPLLPVLRRALAAFPAQKIHLSAGPTGVCMQATEEGFWDRTQIVVRFVD